MSDTNPTLYARVGGKPAIEALVDGFYHKVQDDYRLNRFFNSNNLAEQIPALKTLLTALFGGSTATAEQVSGLLDDFFMTAFARDKRKSFVGGSDFGFFGYIIEQDHPSTNYLCDAHSHLLKFMPDDSHYDVVIDHLTATLQELNLDNAVQNEVLALAEQARNPLLGK
jgi:hemoglobin